MGGSKETLRAHAHKHPRTGHASPLEQGLPIHHTHIQSLQESTGTGGFPKPARSTSAQTWPSSDIWTHRDWPRAHTQPCWPQAPAEDHGVQLQGELWKNSSAGSSPVAGLGPGHFLCPGGVVGEKEQGWVGCSEERPVAFLGPPGSPSSHSSAGCSQAGWMSHAANCYVALGKSLAGTLT